MLVFLLMSFSSYTSKVKHVRLVITGSLIFYVMGVDNHGKEFAKRQQCFFQLIVYVLAKKISNVVMLT